MHSSVHLLFYFHAFINVDMRLLLTIIMTVMILQSRAQTVSGRITGNDGVPLAGATILLEDNSGTSSDENGKYSLKASPGNHQLTIKLITFTEKKLDFTISSGEEKTIDVVLDNEAIELKYIVISAGKFEQKIEDITVSMEVIQPKLIQDINTTSFDDALQQVPGVNVTDGQANIRGGAGWSYGAGSRVQVLVDDLPLLAADANDAKWSFIPVENIEQVEVIKGASSALFGSSALNGVINIRTAFPKAKPLTKIVSFIGEFEPPGESQMAWYKSFHRWQSGLSFLHSQQIKQLDLTVGANAFSDQAYRQGENENRLRFNFNTRYRNKKIQGLSYGVNFNHQKTVGTLFFLWENDTTGALLPLGGTDTATTTLSDYTTYRTNVDPFITFINKKGNSFRLRTRYFNTTNKNNTNQESTGELYYAELQYQHKIKNYATVTTGILEMYSDIVSQLYNNHQSNNMAAFLQADAKWKKFTFSAGGRAEQSRIDSVTDDITPVVRMGANYHLLRETYLRASYGQGYRFPSVAEKFVRTNVGSLYIYPNDSLKSEKGYSAEFGVKQGLKVGSWAGYVDAAYFINLYKDMMEFTFARWGTVFDPLFGLGFKSINVGDIRITGIELTTVAKGKIGPLSTMIYGGYTYINPEQIRYDSSYVRKLPNGYYLGSDSSNFLKYRYKHSLKADVELSYKKISLGVSIRYNSEMKNIDRIFTDNAGGFEIAPGVKHFRDTHPGGTTIFDARLAYIIHKNFRISGIAKNVFNKVYVGRPADVQPPLTFILQLSAEF